METVSWSKWLGHHLIVICLLISPIHYLRADEPAAPAAGGAADGNPTDADATGQSAGELTAVERVAAAAALEMTNLDVDHQPAGIPSKANTPYTSTYCAASLGRIAALAKIVKRREEASRTKAMQAGGEATAARSAIPEATTDAAAVENVSIPDIVALNESDVLGAQGVLQTLYTMMYGRNFEHVSPPQPIGPSGEMKILVTAARYTRPGIPQKGIPSQIRRLIEQERVIGQAAVRNLENAINVKAEEREKTGTPYRPEALIRVANAVQRVHSGSGMAGSEGFVTPFLSLIQRALNDYLNVLTLQAELDHVQVAILTFLTKVALTKNPDFPHRSRELGNSAAEISPLRAAVEGLLVATLRDGTTNVPSVAADALYALTGPDEKLLTKKEKEKLATLLLTLEDWQSRLEHARAHFGQDYETALIAYYIVLAVGRPDGRRPIELSSFMRSSWIDDLEQNYKTWVLIGVNLLNRKALDHASTDSFIDLENMKPDDLVTKFLLDPRMHEFILNQFINQDTMLREYRTFSARQARRHQLESLDARMDDAQLRNIERRVSSAAVASAKNFFGVASKSIPAPLLSTLQAILTEDEAAQAKAAKTTGEPPIRGRVRQLPSDLPHFIRGVRNGMPPFTGAAAQPTPAAPAPAAAAAEGEEVPEEPPRTANGNSDAKPEAPVRGAVVMGDLNSVLAALDKEAQELFNDDIKFQREFLSPDNVQRMTKDMHDKRKALQARALVLAGEVNALLIALENAYVAEPVAEGDKSSPERRQLQSQADSAATLAHFLIRLAPAVARSVIHDRVTPTLRSLQRRLVVEVIQSMMDNPEEVAGAFESEKRLGGTTLEGIRNSKGWLWTKIVGGVLVLGGSIAGAWYFGTGGSDLQEVDTPQDVQTAPLNPGAPAGAPQGIPAAPPE